MIRAVRLLALNGGKGIDDSRRSAFQNLMIH